MQLLVSLQKHPISKRPAIVINTGLLLKDYNQAKNLNSLLRIVNASQGISSRILCFETLSRRRKISLFWSILRSHPGSAFRRQLRPCAVSLILQLWNPQLNVRAREPDLLSLNSGCTLGWAALCHICQQKVVIVSQYAKTVVPHVCKRLVPRVCGHQNPQLLHSCMKGHCICV